MLNKADSIYRILTGRDPAFAHYNTMAEYPELVDAIVEHTPQLQPSMCQRPSTTFLKQQCDVEQAFSPFPETEAERETNRTLLQQHVGKGAFGQVTRLQWTDLPLLTKSPLKYDASSTPEMIKELFVNMVVLNDFVDRVQERPEDYAQLVPTYGFFVCDQRKDGKLVRHCETGDEYPYVYLIQQEVKGQSLRNWLDQKPSRSTDATILPLLVKVFRTLALLQASPFKVTHNDLSPDNILVADNGDVYLIDWGRVSFVYEGETYPSAVERIQEFDRPGQRLVTGAADLFLILSNLLSDGPTLKDIKALKENMIASLFPDQLFRAFLYEEELYLTLHGLEEDSEAPDAMHHFFVQKLNRFTYHDALMLLENAAKQATRVVTPAPTLDRTYSPMWESPSIHALNPPESPYFKPLSGSPVPMFTLPTFTTVSPVVVKPKGGYVPPHLRNKANVQGRRLRARRSKKKKSSKKKSMRRRKA